MFVLKSGLRLLLHVHSTTNYEMGQENLAFSSIFCFVSEEKGINSNFPFKETQVPQCLGKMGIRILVILFSAVTVVFFLIVLLPSFRINALHSTVLTRVA